MRDFHDPFRGYNPLENLTAEMSGDGSQTLNDAISGPIREAQHAIIDNITRATTEARQAVIDSIILQTQEAQRAMIDSLAAGLPVFRPEFDFHSMSAVAFNQKAARAINSLRLFPHLRPTIDAIDNIWRTTETAIPKVFQDAGERQIERIDRLIASTTYGIVNQIERYQRTHFPIFDYPTNLNAAAHVSIPNLDGMFPNFLTEYLFGIVNKPLSEFDEADIETALHGVEELIESRIQESGKNIPALQFWLTILLSLAIWLAQTVQGNRTTTELKREIADSKEELKRHITESSNETIANATERILEIVKSIVPERSDEILYVVQRPAKLRLKPTSRSAILTTLHPNQLVSVCQRPGRWMCVEFYDFNKGLLRRGWVYTKYLKRLARSSR